MQNPDIEKIIIRQVKKANRWCKEKLPDLVGKEAVKHFKDNFRQEGFVDNGLLKWKDVKRRDPQSAWYGFDYKGEKRADHPVKYGKKGKRLKDQKKLNFSRAATRRKILTGNTLELQDSIRYIKAPGQATITSDKPYASVQNNGGPIKVFGKKTVQLQARPFIGDSKELNEKIDKTIFEGLDVIFNNK
ncbi:phage virion morphogenesis protein [Parabacteroides gordonii]|jgi:phage gpG-like protein|uniref:phage virion morphogenesis protein n=1 Tax=Parabacteroides gordonii TaxID=574930 RepID=UPI000ED37702|nr:phage virion morphogenesis protein [Parabacteroides gordonii]RGP09281.1 hypothetical protein DXB27_23700 [Parabacteroides gordonii]